MHAFNKMTEIVDGEPRIKPDPPLIVPAAAFMTEEFATRFTDWVHTTCARTGRRSTPTVGACWRGIASSTWPRRSSGSAASGRARGSHSCSAATTTTRCSCNSKEAQPSVLEPFCGRERIPESRRPRRRRAAADAGRRRHSARMDADLGHRRRRARLLLAAAARLEGVRRDRADGAGGYDPLRRALRLDARPAHARSGDRVAIAAYLGKSRRFDRAIAEFRDPLRRPERTRLPGAPSTRLRPVASWPRPVSRCNRSQGW